MTTDEIRRRMAELRANIERLAVIDGDLDETARAEWASDTAEYDQLEAQLTERADRATRLTSVRADTVVETGDGAAAADHARSVQIQDSAPENIYDLSDLHMSRDSVAYGQALRDRAMRSIESWDSVIDAGPRESAESLVKNAANSRRDRDVAEHILRHGSPDYFSAFCKVLANPTMGLQLLEGDEARAMRAALAEGATTTGGFMVPVLIDPTIILQNAGISNPFRSIATVKSITTQTWKGVTSAGVTAEWTAEAAEAADASPTIAQPTITPVRADAYVQASFEMTEDTSIATDLAMLFADARDRLEGTAFAVGTGSTQPNGVVTDVAATTASRVASTTNGAFGAVDVFALDNALPQRYRSNASWVGNKSVYNLARQFSIGTGGMTGSFWVDFGGGHPSSLIGYPVYESSAMLSSLSTATASTDNVVVLGDFRQYYIIDRIGMSVAYNPLVIGSNRRPTGEVGWFAYWRVGGKTINTDAFRILQA